MKSILLYLDFIGRKPSILMDRNKIHKTIYGGLLSLTSGVILFAASIYFSYLLFSRTSFIVMVNDEYNPLPFKNWTNEEFSIILMDKLLDPIQDADRLYGVKADYWWNRPTFYPNGTVTYKTEPHDIALEKCNISVHFKESKDLWIEQRQINSSTCIKRDLEINSSLLFGANNYTGIVFWIYKCQNSSTKNDCFPNDVIDAQLTNVFFLVRFKDYYFDHNVIGNNAVPYIYSDLVMCSSTAYKRTMWNMIVTKALFSLSQIQIFTQTSPKQEMPLI
jgi:hypothetical protein